MNTTAKNWVYTFGDPLPAGAEPKALLGGKGASLAAMTTAGWPVPPGFTISTEACAWFYAHEGRWPAGLEDQVREQLHRLEQTAGREYASGRSPLLVSVRSGAAVSMPGMMDTLLNCGLHAALIEQLGSLPAHWAVYSQFIEAYAKTVAGLRLDVACESGSREYADQLLAEFARKAGEPFPQDPWILLVNCINAVFRSWQSDRARAYRHRHGIDGLPGTAVNVQAMFPSEVSGILFTRDPNRPGADHMVIEASTGLGEAIVSGAVAPDRFVVQRDDFSACQVTSGEKHRRVLALEESSVVAPVKGASGPATQTETVCLKPDQVRRLCELALEVERHFDAPMDIEWGWAEGRLALLQCRPIRGLELAQAAEELRQAEIQRLAQLANGRRRTWVAHNLGETLRQPTPLTWDITRHFMSGNGGFGQLYRELGYRPAPDVCAHGFLELIAGRIYADPDRMARLFWSGLPMTYDMDAVRKDRNALNRAPAKFDAERAEGDFLFRLPGLLRDLWKGARQMKALRTSVRQRFDEQALPAFLEYVERKRGMNLSELSFDSLLQELKERRQRALDEFGMESLLPGFFGGLALSKLEALLAQLLGPLEGPRLAGTLATTLEHDTTFEQNVLLEQVARRERTFEEFLDKFGHRCANEMELAEPRWREEPAEVRALVARLAKVDGRSLTDLHRTNTEKYQAARGQLPDLLAKAGGSSFLEDIEKLVREARALLPYREIGKHYLMMGHELIRRVLLEIARRTGLGRDLFFLQLTELEELSADNPARSAARLADAIARRKLRWQAAGRLVCGEMLDSANLDRLGLPEKTKGGDELSGEAVAGGVGEGPAQVVFDPQEAGDLGAGYILVCPSTDPGWTPLFINARGLIVERGGILSHGAIVARDFGIPAVVCPNATGILRSGETIRVDGNSGRIQRLKEAAHG